MKKKRKIRTKNTEKSKKHGIVLQQLESIRKRVKICCKRCRAHTWHTHGTYSTQIAHTRHTQTFARDTLPSEFNKDTAQEDVRLNSQKKPRESRTGNLKMPN